VDGDGELLSYCMLCPKMGKRDEMCMIRVRGHDYKSIAWQALDFVA